ncbi:MAG TPA: adenosine-specific kinase [Spirochaetota bacterium]|nr:adenosine-specific kinase [Spirochaetota bacterium]
MDIQYVVIDKPDDMNFILGHSHFIKTVEDLYEAVIGSVPGVKFGIAFCEASQDRLVRWTGNDDKLVELARKNAMNIGAGHSFIIFMDNAFPVNMLNAVKMVPEVCRVFCATANPVHVLVAETGLGRGIIGVVDGYKPLGIETEKDISWRKEFLRKIGYKQ